MTLASQNLAYKLRISVSVPSRATARAHPQPHNMIQRSLLRQIRASSSRLQRLPVSSAPRPLFPAPRIPSLSSRQQHLYPRCYSTTAEAKASPEGEATPTEEPPSEAKEEDPMKKELEAKKAEVIDLKVAPATPHHSP